MPTPSTPRSNLGNAPRRRGAAILVAAGILCSRLAGLVRQRVLTHFLGIGDEADAFAAAFRIPNVLQNLFGEGALSASFIPVYAQLLAQGNTREADRVARAVGTILALAVSVLVLLGVVAAPWLTDLLAYGFHGPKHELTVRLVRIVFPGTGLLVLSAWCLGVLNSHHRFLLSYAAPVAWNAAIIGAVLWDRGQSGAGHLTVVAAWGSVVGSAAQLLVQLPVVFSLLSSLRPALDTRGESIRRVFVNFGPAFVSRGVVQLSAYVDSVIASLLGTGAVAALTNAQALYTLPVSLFGMSIAASELPAMSADGAAEDGGAALRRRLEHGLGRIAFFIIPSAVAFLALGDVVAGALYQTGRFQAMDSRYVWLILAGSSVGLLASTQGRLYSSAFFALGDTRTPLRFAVIRVTLTIILGFVAAVYLPGWLGLPSRLGAAGLTASAGIAGWIEYLLLQRGLWRRIGPTRFAPGYLWKLWGSACGGAGIAWIVRDLFGRGDGQPILTAFVVLVPYGLVYVTLAVLFRIPAATDLWGAIRRRV